MGFFKDDNGKYKWTMVSGVAVMLALLAVVISLVIFYEPKPSTPVNFVINPPNVVNNNYYTVEGIESPLDTNKCSFFKLTAEGYALVCPKS